MARDILVMDCQEREVFWITLKGDRTIHFASTAEEGLGMLSDRIGLVFINLRLPDMKGTEVLRRIKKEYPAAAVILITSCGKEDTCAGALRKGDDGCLGRPLKEEQYPDIPSHLVDGVLRVRNYIDQNYTATLTLHDACKMASISKTYFCHFFKRVTGHSLRNYQHAVKVRKAEELLKDKSMSIVDVALQLGYNDSNYFSTVYKKFTGSSPKHRRTSAQSLEENEEKLNRV